MPRTRILQVISGLNRGGIETWLTRVAELLDRDSFQIDFLLYRLNGGALADSVRAAGSSIHYIPLEKRLASFRAFPQIFGSFLERGQYQVVHCHGTVLPGYFLRLAHRAGVPVRIAHAHTAATLRAEVAPPLVRNLLRHWIWGHSTHGCACSADAARAVFGKNWSRDPRFSVLHCGIDTTLFLPAGDRDTIRASLGIAPGRPVVIHVGNFSPIKNYGFLLKTAAAAVARRPDVTFLLVGDGPLRQKVENRARRMGLDGHVIFCGLRRDVPLLMKNAADLLCLPSLGEGLPVTLIEAQAAGLRCLVSDCVTSEARIVSEAVTYLPLSSGAPAWAEQILRALALDRPRAETWLAQLKGSDFTVEESARKIDKLYRTALAMQTRSCPA